MTSAGSPPFVGASSTSPLRAPPCAHNRFAPGHNFTVAVPLLKLHPGPSSLIAANIYSERSEESNKNMRIIKIEGNPQQSAFV